MKRAAWWTITILAAPIALYGAAFLVFRERMFPPPLAESFGARPWGIFPHALAGAIALVMGPFQFHRRLLVRRRALHRVMGKIYVIAAVAVGVTGLYMAWFAFGGPVTRLGFGGLAVTLLVTTIKAFTSIRGGDIAAHRQWMIRSFALIFAAVTLRIELPILSAIFGDFTPAYRIVAWLCWVPNLLVTETQLLAERRAHLQPVAGL